MDIEIKVADYSSASMAVSPDKAEALFRTIAENLRKGNKVKVNFAEVKLVITAFLNIAIGKLFGEDNIKADSLDNDLILLTEDKRVKGLIEEVVVNSKEFYANKKLNKPNLNDHLEDSINGNN